MGISLHSYTTKCDVRGMLRFSVGLASSLVGFSVGGTAWAAGPEDLQMSTPDAVGIYGGTTVAECGWPSTVDMQGACSGTLVHPQVVIFAAHCGSNYSQIWMGENIEAPKRTLKPEFCKTFPGGGPGSGKDFAFCKLTEPVLDVPLVPILMGCETDVLKPGQEVTIVGFGDADNGPYGIKREVTTTITGFQNGGGEINIGGGGKDSCQGDSGGPVFVKIPSGEWRVFGITSYGGACGTGGVYSMMHNGIEWIETEAGIDVTPCHDAQGNWQPGFGCKGFPVDPGVGGGEWAMGCGGGAVTDFSASCGEPFNPEPDMTPPIATILAPMDGQEFMGEGNVPVTVNVQATDVGWGIKDVRLTINGADFKGNVDSFMPYDFPLNFPTGGFCIGAVATDLAGNTGEATPVCIGINGPPPPPPEPETTTDGEGGSEGGSETGGELESEGSGDGSGGAPTEGGEPGTSGGSSGGLDSGLDTGVSASAGLTDGDEDDSGCGCRSGQEPGDGLLGLAGLGLLGLAGQRRRF